MSRLVTVYKSRRLEDVYLFVDRAEGLARVPGDLMSRFGNPVVAMQLALTPERKLARVIGATVLEAIDQRGFYLQLPPRPEREDA